MFIFMIVDGIWFLLARLLYIFFFCKQKTAYEMRISDWRSDVCSSDLAAGADRRPRHCCVPGADLDPGDDAHLRAQDHRHLRRHHADAALHAEQPDNLLPGPLRPHDRAGIAPLTMLAELLPQQAFALLLVFVRLGSALMLMPGFGERSEEHTSELQSLMRISYAVFC